MSLYLRWIVKVIKINGLSYTLTSLQFAAREIARRSSLSVDLRAHKNADQKTVSSNLRWMIREILVYLNSFVA